jgi:hypothetical protein
MFSHNLQKGVTSVKYLDCLELDSEAGLLKVKDSKDRWHTYKKAETYEGRPPGAVTPFSVQVFPDGRILLVHENGVLSAPPIILVENQPHGPALKYSRQD